MNCIHYVGLMHAVWKEMEEHHEGDAYFCTLSCYIQIYNILIVTSSFGCDMLDCDILCQRDVLLFATFSYYIERML